MKNNTVYISAVLALSIFSSLMGNSDKSSIASKHYNTIETSRLMVAIHPSSDFSIEQFALKSYAEILTINPLNPYQVIQEDFLNSPYVVIPFLFKDEEALRIFPSKYGYRYVVFKNESLKKAVEQANDLIKKGPRYSCELDTLSVKEASSVYSLMKKIDELFIENGVQYWAGRETLLGAVRHNGLIPWDDYLYLYLTESEEYKLAALKEAFNEKGIEIHNYQKGFYKIYDKQSVILKDLENPEQNLPFRFPAANLFCNDFRKKR